MNNIIHFTVSTHTLLHVLLLGFISFVVSMLITPIYTTFAYRREWWKKQRTEAMGGAAQRYTTNSMPKNIKDTYRLWQA